MIYNKLVKHLLLPLYYYKNNNQLFNRLENLEKSQFFNASVIKEQQLGQLKKILVHSSAQVPFYRDRFNSGNINPSSFCRIEDLQAYPFLTKSDIQSHLTQLTATNYPSTSLYLDSSGGSTGKPTSFYKDRRRYFESRADIFRHDRWSGWDIGEKFATLWGAQREFEKQPSLRSQLIEKYIFRTFGFNAFDISEVKVLRYLEDLKRISPVMILAYANVAYLFADVIIRNSVDMSSLKLKGLITSAETLTENMRNTIESAFQCKVLNRYGSREVGVIASECLHQEGLHIDCESLYVEIIKGGQNAAPGELGEIVVTDLWNYGMPLIRYRTGDVGIMSDHTCSCGRGLPMLKEVQGRVGDFFVDAQGGLVHGEYFTHLFYGIDGIEQFQLIQEDLNTISLNILPGKHFSTDTLEPVVLKIKRCLGSDVRVDVKLSTSSFVEESGKFRYTISKISGNSFHHSPLTTRGAS